MPGLTLAVVFSLMLVATGSWNAWQISQNFKGGVVAEFQLEQLVGEIIHLDEVLTMSARMAAATGDLQWEERYRTYEPKLDAAIKQAIQIAPETYADHASQTDAANIKLVDLENRAFALVHRRQTGQASALLFSSDYETQKQVYAAGMGKTTDALQQRMQSSLDAYGAALSRSSLISFVSLLVLTAAWAVILILINQYIHKRRQAERRLQAAKWQLEQSNASLEVSKTALRQKADTLEQTLQELKKTQAQMVHNEKMSSLGLLVAGIAHEINNPVNFVYANLDFVEDYARDLLDFVRLHQRHYPNPAREIQSAAKAIDLAFLQQDLLRILKSMRVGSERIREIVLSLRMFSRSDEAALKPIDIHEGIESTLLILSHRLQAQPKRPEIEVIRDYDTALPLVECYPGPLNQVFLNILANAIDAIEEAAIAQSEAEFPTGQIKIRTSVVEEQVEIAIADTGTGIPEAVQKQLFDAFFTTKPVGKGTGLGMSVSHQIVTEKHRGKLTYFSTLGRGTEFVIQLPIQQRAD
ncbi:sensor histidine kinase [Vasconcelosia minhoensis]|nr:ATP-binding protein [Romeria gracilis]